MCGACGETIRILYDKFRVYLESVSENDADDIARNANDYEIAYNVASAGAFPYPYGLDDARAFISSTKKAASDGTGCHFGIHLAGSGRLIGAAGIIGRDAEAKSCSIGYWLGKEHWGRGYAKEAVILLSTFTFMDRDTRTVNADVLSFNSRSIAMLGSVGFSREQSYREMRAHYSGYAEELRYSIGKEEFLESYRQISENVVVS